MLNLRQFSVPYALQDLRRSSITPARPSAIIPIVSGSGAAADRTVTENSASAEFP